MRFLRWACLTLALCMLMVFTGCKSAASPKGKVIGLCLPPTGENWSGKLLACARDAAAQWDGQLDAEPTPEIPGGLLGAVEELIKRKVDIVVLYAYDPEEGEKAAEALADAQIPLILVGNAIRGDAYAALVTADHYGIGKAAGEYLARRLSGKGKVLVLEGTAGIETDLRDQGFEEALASYPDMSIVGTESCGYLRDAAKTQTRLCLEEHPDIAAIFAQGDDMAIGAIESLEAVYSGAEAVVSIGGSKAAIEMLMKNHRYLKATWNYPPAIAADAVSLAIAHLSGEAMPEDRRVLLPIDPIDPVNAIQRYEENAIY